MNTALPKVFVSFYGVEKMFELKFRSYDNHLWDEHCLHVLGRKAQLPV